MRFSDDDLNEIYDRTSGYCHLCHRKLAFSNYGILGARGAWEVEHSNPQARGGTHMRRNLYAACIPCNRSKSCRSTKSVRCANGVRKAPLCVQRRKIAKEKQALAGGLAGATIGAALFGPLGAAAGFLIGASGASRQNPDRN
jgi:5-methylcytosine-specific restriction endonuclease McrA